LGEAVRADVFVGKQNQKIPSSAGAKSSEYAAPTGLDFVFGLWFYKDVAPAALRKNCPTKSSRADFQGTATFLLGLAPKGLIVAVGVERRVNVDEVNAGIGQFFLSCSDCPPQ